MQSTLLIIHNIGFMICAALLVFLIALVYVKDHKKKENRLIMLGFFSILIWVVTHIIGVSITDPHISRLVFMAHASILFISAFLAHFIFVFLGKEKEQRIPIILIYIFSVVFLIVYLVFPDTFILDSVPKLYFPNYYVAGNLHWVMSLVSNVIIPAYFLIYMILQYRHSNMVMKNRIKYLFVGLLCGYSLGGLGIPLVFTAHPVIFGFTIDPIYSIFFIPFFSIPFTYAVLKYELMDIRIVAKRAFVYALIVAVVSISISLLVFSNDIIRSVAPAFPRWILPAVSSFFGVSIGFFIWSRLRESDMLKSEFITVVTHKFRTPLTEIRWATESLSKNLSENDKNNIATILRSNNHLIELTNLLVQLSDADNVNYDYRLHSEKLDDIVESIKTDSVRRAKLKDVGISFSGVTTVNVAADEGKMRFVIQTLLDNAISYTPTGGTIKVELKDETDNFGQVKSVILSVTDSGIGFSSGEANRIFGKFWRSPKALTTDTEGMGIGLFMTKRIVEKHSGLVWASSEGPNKGATFFLRLPVAKEV